MYARMQLRAILHPAPPEAHMDKSVDEIKALDHPTLVDLYEAARRERLALDKESQDRKENEDAYKAELIHRMVDTKQGVLASRSWAVKLRETDVPTARDWDKIHEYIVANGAWELMHARLGTMAVQERWEAGIEVPGVEKFTKQDVTLSKLTRKP